MSRDPIRTVVAPLLLLLAQIPGLAACAAVRPSAGIEGARSLHPFLAGAAARDNTPEVGGEASPTRLAGFSQGLDATGVHDDLYARALVLQAGEESVAIVALDLIGFFHDDVVLIREEVRARFPDVGVRSIMVASTHTHAGPDMIGLWTPAGRTIDPGYVAHVRTEAARAVAEAWERRRPARLSFAAKDLPHLVRDSRLPLVVDALALLLKVESQDGRETIATLLNFPSHPESLGRGNALLSSDYPGAARRALEEAFGGISIFTSGAIGGLMTPLGVALADPATGEPVPEKSPKMAETLGRVLAGAVIEAWRSRGPDQGEGQQSIARGAIEVRSIEVRVPLGNARFVRGLAEGRIWPRAVADDGSLTSEAAVITVRAPGTPGAPGGSATTVAQLACVPGEIYPELVVGGIQDPQDPGADHPGAPHERPLRPMMSGRHRFVIGLCNDELGYIIPRSQWDEKAPYAYGRDTPQYGEVNSAGADVAPILIEAFAGLLR